nr:hypothetical protein [uncultured Rhodoferax sp.]
MLDVAMVQRLLNRVFWAVRSGLFAYNGLPTIAVAKRLLVQGASSFDAPFFHGRSFLFNYLKLVVDESHPKFFDHCPH